MSGAKCKRCGTCCQTISYRFSQVLFDEEWVKYHGGVVKGMDIYLPLRCSMLSISEEGIAHCKADPRPKYCQAWPAICGPQPWILNMGCKFFD